MLHGARSFALTVVAAAALAAWQEPAAAQETDPEQPTESAAASLAEAGAALAAEGRWAEAVVKFEQAAERERTPVHLFNLAQAERNVGHLLAAKAHFTESHALAERDGASAVAQLAGEALRELATKIPRLRLVVAPDARQVEVWVDGKRAELSQSELELDPGRYELRVTAASEEPFSRNVTLTEGQRASVEVRFPTREPAPTPPPRPAPAKRPEPAPSAGPPVGAWVLGGLGVAALAAGTAFHLQRNAKLDQAAEGCVRSADGWSCPASVRNDPDHQALKDDAARAETLRNVLFGLGSAALVGGGVWWALSGGSERSGPSVAVALEPGTRSGGAKVRWQF